MAAAAAAAAHDPSKPRNTAVYVQGLHPDTPLHLISQHFAKCGVILVNADGSDRVKRYTDAQDMPTGDALVIYHKPESVEMVHVACLILILLHQACMILDESLLDGATIRVSPAVFSKPAPGPDNTLPAAKKQRVREKMRDKLAWTADEPDDSTGMSFVSHTHARAGKSKTVILKHMFTLAALDADPGEMLDLAQDVREECEKRCGPVNRVIVYDGEADGVVAVRFKKCPAAEACVKLMHGRWFDKRCVCVCIGIYLRSCIGGSRRVWPLAGKSSKRVFGTRLLKMTVYMSMWKSMIPWMKMSSSRRRMRGISMNSSNSPNFSNFQDLLNAEGSPIFSAIPYQSFCSLFHHKVAFVDAPVLQHILVH